MPRHAASEAVRVCKVGDGRPGYDFVLTDELVLNPDLRPLEINS